jgi:archaellum component FlaF (FlaF/FlaG flagellin family)
MKKVSLIACVTLLFVACQNNNSNLNSSEDTSIDTNMVAMSDIECYSYISNRDTATLNFTNTNDTIIGELNYNLYEKDSNKGIVEGEMKGDTLILNYIFSSEGKESVRQVIMLKKAGKLIEATGEMDEKNGKFIFKNRSALNFEQGIVFTKTDCN